MKLARYIVTGITVALLGMSGCEVSHKLSELAIAKARTQIPGYTGCDHHCGNAVLQLEKEDSK